MDELLDVVGDDEDHPLADLLDVIGMLIAQYAKEQHGLKQADLRKEIGTQGVFPATARSMPVRRKR